MTVVYPNNFVLMHGFKGEPLKRVSDLPAARLRPFTGTDVSLQILEKALLKAVQAANKIARPQPGTPDLCNSPLLSDRSPHSLSPAQRKRARSQSPSPVADKASPALSQGSNKSLVSALYPGTPSPRKRARSEAASSPEAQTETPSPKIEGRSLARQESDAKVEVMPSIVASPKRVKKTAPTSLLSPNMVKNRDAGDPRKRVQSMTTLVSRLMRSSDCGRVPRAELEASLLEGGFAGAEIADNLQRLDAQSKILLLDGMAFIVA